jgi:hypothetical protein
MNIRTQFTDFFLSTQLPALDFIVKEEMDRRSEQYPNFLKVENTTQSIVQESETTGLGLFSQVTEAGSLRYDELQQAYNKTYTPVDWALGIRVSHRMMADDKFGIVKSGYQALARAAKETQEVEAANVYNRAFNSSYLGPDGKVLCATDHPLVGGGTQANRPTNHTDLDIASLEAALTNFRKFVDHRGKKERLLAKNLVVASAGIFAATEILKSPLRSDTAENAINAFSNGAVEGGTLKPVAYDYLTDDDAWFLTAPASDLRLRFIWREKFSTMHDKDFDTRSLKTGAWMTFVVSFGGYRGVYGSQGA